MTKETTIDWKGGSRRIVLQEPRKQLKMHILATAPMPLQMTPESLGWMNRVMVEGTDLSKQQVESMHMTDGLGLLNDVLSYWQTESEDSDKVAEVDVEGLELNEDGAVELEDMR